MTNKEHIQSLRQRLELAKAERNAQDAALEDLEALVGRRERYAQVEPGQMRAAEAAFDEALAEAPEAPPIRPLAPVVVKAAASEELRIPSFALFA